MSDNVTTEAVALDPEALWEHVGLPIIKQVCAPIVEGIESQALALEYGIEPERVAATLRVLAKSIREAYGLESM